jgi:hypothetical protein
MDDAGNQPVAASASNIVERRACRVSVTINLPT